MRWPSRIRSLALLGGLGVILAGCGSSGPEGVEDDPVAQSALEEVGEAYRFYTLRNHRPPKNSAEFDSLEMMSPNGVIGVRQGDIIVEWGAELPDTSAEGPSEIKSDKVLAYQKQVPEQGGYVLLLDRTVKRMSAEEFQAAPKAGEDGSEK